MPVKAFFSALILLAFFSSAGLAQDQKSDQPILSLSAKTKIAGLMDGTDHYSVFAFTKTGEKTATIPLDSMTRMHFHSLEDYVASVQSDTEKTNSASSTEELAKPIASCQDPKALDPPPPCVICKNGKILCSKATFGSKVVMEDGRSQKSRPQE